MAELGGAVLLGVALGAVIMNFYHKGCETKRNRWKPLNIRGSRL